MRKYQKSAVSSTTSSGEGSGRPLLMKPSFTPSLETTGADFETDFEVGVGVVFFAAGVAFFAAGVSFFGTKKSLMLKSLTAVYWTS